jgi:hypothetical protein
MSWTTPSDLRAQVERLWERGELLREAAIGWPLRLRLRGPGSSELAERFEAVREWVAALRAQRHVRLEWREVMHRVLGRQQLPAEVWIDSRADALALIGRVRDAGRFDALRAETSARLPALLPWLEKRPLQALALIEAWPRLLAVVDWLRAHPRPGVYLRQVDAPGVDSKFIEAQRGVLTELLDLALPPGAIDTTAASAGGFARRYGFRDKPSRIRLRTLDPSLALLHGVHGCVDVSLEAQTFAALELPVERVYITENETNYLAFPALPRALVIFGAGYGWESLAAARWLATREIHYWGDIDTHGFAILDALRAHFPHARSLLMDRATLLAHEAHWGEEASPVRRELGRLTAAEAALYQDLVDDRIRPRLRLEQERIRYGELLLELASDRQVS